MNSAFQCLILLCAVVLSQSQSNYFSYRLYTDTSYKGKTLSMTGSSMSCVKIRISGANDNQMSSYEHLSGRKCIRFYRNDKCSGSYFEGTSSSRTMPSGWNDDVRSYSGCTPLPPTTTTRATTTTTTRPTTTTTRRTTTTTRPTTTTTRRTTTTTRPTTTTTRPTTTTTRPTTTTTRRTTTTTRPTTTTTPKPCPTCPTCPTTKPPPTCPPPTTCATLPPPTTCPICPTTKPPATCPPATPPPTCPTPPPPPTCPPPPPPPTCPPPTTCAICPTLPSPTTCPICPTQPPSTTSASTTLSTTAPGTPFECKLEGYSADTMDCNKFHSCTPNPNGGWIDREMSCPATLVFCQRTGNCDYNANCPCNL